MKVSNHDRIRMRTVSSSENIVRCPDVGDPVTHRLINRLLQCLLSGMNGNDFRAKHFHSVNIQSLSLAISRSHVNDAFKPEHGGNCCGGNAVLTCPGFGDDPAFSHAASQENLPYGIV